MILKLKKKQDTKENRVMLHNINVSSLSAFTSLGGKQPNSWFSKEEGRWWNSSHLH